MRDAPKKIIQVWEPCTKPAARQGVVSGGGGLEGVGCREGRGGGGLGGSAEGGLGGAVWGGGLGGGGGGHHCSPFWTPTLTLTRASGES